MNCQEKKKYLNKIIQEELNSEISDNYVLLDLPYHGNLGDTLIWEGELEYLKSVPFKCLYSTSKDGNFEKIGKSISPDTIILLHGGGNFGDIWPAHNLYRKKVIANFPNNKTIIFPQTIYYEDKNKLEEDARFYRNYPNVTICARDAKSLEILETYFSNNPSLLVPDMAFCIDIKKYERKLTSKGSVFIKRTDKEFKDSDKYSLVPDKAFVSDWLQIGRNKIYQRGETLKRYAKALDKRLPMDTDLKNYLYDMYWHYRIRPYNVTTAINFIDRFEHIYTTRLHAAILSIILEKNDITLFDNNYGKLSSFYNTWLSDVDSMKLI